MKILFVINMLSTGGAERVASRLCSYWAKNHEVTIFQTSFNNKKEYFLADEIRYINPCDEKRLSRLQLIRKLRKAVKTSKPDVVVSFLDTGHFYTSLACMGLKTIHVCSERNDPYNVPKQKIFRIMRIFAFNLCKAVVFQTEGARDFFARKIRKKGFIIPNPIVYKDSLLPIESREKIVVSAGRLEEQKNYPLLIKAFEMFSKSNRDYVLNIFGSGSLENELNDLIKSDKFENKIFIKKFKTNIEEEFKKSSIFVMSSSHEGLPNSLMEAIAIGTPSISTDANPGGPKFILSRCKGSILVNNNDLDGLSKAMNEIASNYKKYYDLAQIDAINLRNDFSLKNIGELWIDLFHKLLEKK